MSRPMLFLTAAWLVLQSLCIPTTQGLNFTFETILGPDSPTQQPSWLADMLSWRAQTLQQIAFNDSLYVEPQMSWVRSSFMQPLIMLHDRYLWDPVAQQYTVDKFLDDAIARYGGMDSVLVWHSYPNIGIDNKNQYDMLRSLPGGIAGVAQMVVDFHRRGVAVLFPYHPWDAGTRDEGAPDAQSMMTYLQSVLGDGFNGDTMSGIPVDFVAANYSFPILTQPEVGLDPDCDDLSFNLATWGYWDYPANNVPAISKYKWLERRHQINICARWNEQHNYDLQQGWFNGGGFVTWENVWGIWRGITPRDGEATRQLGTLLRYLAPVVVNASEWEPHTAMLQSGIFASKFVAPAANLVAGSTGVVTVWLIVSTLSQNATGAQLTVPNPASDAFFLDLYHGSQLLPALSVSALSSSNATLSFDVEANAFGAVMMVKGDPSVLQSPALQDLLTTMKSLTAQPLSSYDDTFVVLPQGIVPVEKTFAPNVSGMVQLDAQSAWNFVINGIEVEGDTLSGVDVQYDLFGETLPMRNHNLTIAIDAFYIDIFPVTNADFSAFLQSSGYVPFDAPSPSQGGRPINFLQSWSYSPANGSYSYPPGTERQPVTFVGLEDATAFCQYYDKRLPTEWEWQYAAQGTDGRLYPWGNNFTAANVPPQDLSRSPRAPTPVDAYPQGASAAGVMDLVGNVWQFTSQSWDSRTRRAILRGGSYYYPQTSNWYFPNTYKLTEHGNYLLMAPSLDRAAQLGFRCAADGVSVVDDASLS